MIERRDWDRLPPASTSLRTLLDAMPQIVWVSTADGCALYVNEVWSRYTGLPTSESFRSGHIRAIHPDDRDEAAQTWADAAASGTPYQCEVRLRAADGSYRWFLSRAVPTEQEGSTLWLGTSTDIHDRKIAEAASRSALQRFSRLADSNAIGIVNVDFETGDFVDANDAFLRTIGYDRADLLARRLNARRLTPPAWKAADAHAIEELRALSTFTPFEKEYLRKDGTSAPVLVGGARVSPNSNEAVCYVLDLTQQKRIGEGLRESEASFRALAEVAPQLVWSSNAQGEMTYFSARWAAYTGLSLEELRADAWTAIHPEDIGTASTAWQNALAGGATEYETEFRIRRHDGEYRWFIVRAAALEDAQGNIVRWVGSCTDVHDTKIDGERQHRASIAFQQAALPSSLPAVPGIVFDAIYQAALTDSQVGGDWYDAFTLADGRIVISVGDVMGKGLDAAVTMNAVRQTIRGAAHIDADPCKILEAVEAVLLLDRPDWIATAFLGVFQPLTGVLEYASAGHPKPLVRTTDGIVRALESVGLPLGIRHFALERESARTRIPAGSLVVLYTDGLTESTRDALEGERRLQETLEGDEVHGAEHPAAKIYDAVVAEARDDIAVLTMLVSPDTIPAV